MIFHLASDLGLRRCEISRLKVDDISENVVRVTGKGPGEGKPRDLKPHPDTMMILDYYMEFRQRIITDALANNPDLSIPKGLMVYHHMGRLGVMQMTALDRRIEMMNRISKLGVKFSYHTLRRTWGRTLWRLNVPLETISDMMGHESTTTTRMYLGITLEDHGEALDRLHKYQQQIRNAKYTKTSINEKLHQIS